MITPPLIEKSMARGRRPLSEASASARSIRSRTGGLTTSSTRREPKLNKTLYAIAERKRVGGIEHFRYRRFLVLEAFQRHLFIDAVERGDVLVDFDARTGHNHGTKFRLRQGAYVKLYGSIVDV